MNVRSLFDRINILSRKQKDDTVDIATNAAAIATNATDIAALEAVDAAAISSSAGATFGGPVVISNTLSVSGSITLGNAATDVTTITSQLTASAGVSGSVFYGDGSNLTGLTPLHAFSVRLASNQTGVAINTATKVAWDTEDYDHGGNFASNKFTAPVDGIYMFSSGIYWLSGMGNGSIGWNKLYVNGSQAQVGMSKQGIGGQMKTDFNGVIKLDAADYVEIFAEQNAGTCVIYASSPHSYFQGALIREI